MNISLWVVQAVLALAFIAAGSMKARRLAQDWRTTCSVIGDRALIVDMTFVNSVEQEGRTLLARWYAEGAQLIAKSKASRELAEAIVGEPLPEFAAAGQSFSQPIRVRRGRGDPAGDARGEQGYAGQAGQYPQQETDDVDQIDRLFQPVDVVALDGHQGRGDPTATPRNNSL